MNNRNNSSDVCQSNKRSNGSLSLSLHYYFGGIFDRPFAVERLLGENSMVILYIRSLWDVVVLW